MTGRHGDDKDGHKKDPDPSKWENPHDYGTGKRDEENPKKDK
jgi:hypothetical protein